MRKLFGQIGRLKPEKIEEYEGDEGFEGEPKVWHSLRDKKKLKINEDALEPDKAENTDDPSEVVINAKGKISVFESTGNYQIYVNEMIEDVKYIKLSTLRNKE